MSCGHCSITIQQNYELYPLSRDHDKLVVPPLNNLTPRKATKSINCECDLQHNLCRALFSCLFRVLYVVFSSQFSAINGNLSELPAPLGNDTDCGCHDLVRGGGAPHSRPLTILLCSACGGWPLLLSGRGSVSISIKCPARTSKGRFNGDVLVSCMD